MEKKIIKKRFTGIVVSDKMDKTVVVALLRKVPHPKYGKLIKKTTRLKADTNGMTIKTGNTVVIEETRPMGKGKFFKVIEKKEDK